MTQPLLNSTDGDYKYPFDTKTPELSGMFKRHDGDRAYLNDRWEDYAGWTLPYLYPPDGYTDSDEMQGDYQSIGAQAVNHLSNKIASTLFHPNRSFFRLDLKEEQYIELEAAGFTRTKLNENMAKVEKQSLRQMEQVSMRTANLMALKRLIALGNALLYMPEEGKVQEFNLRSYVIKRDMSGEMHTLITKDSHLVATLPTDIQTQTLNEGLKMEDSVEIYTGVFRVEGGKYVTKQEVGHHFIVDRDFGVYDKDTLPWVPLTWNLVRGSDYGVGLVEEYSGDFHTLSTLSETVLNLAAIAADIKLLVNPMGQTSVDQLNKAAPGAAVAGNPDDIAYLQLEKLADLSFVQNQLDRYERRIGGAFLLNSAVTRDAERVTAEEIRRQAQELEESLGGVYSRLAEEMQQPLARRLVMQMDDRFKGQELTILTGVEALGRMSDLDQMLMLVQDLGMLNALPEDVRARIKLGNFIAALGTARHVDYKEWLMTDEEFAKQQKQNVQQEADTAGAVANAEQTAQPPTPL